MYQRLDGTTHIDYRYNRMGQYRNDPSVPRPFRKATIKRESGPGKVCGGCGITRSRMNKCECNS